MTNLTKECKFLRRVGRRDIFVEEKMVASFREYWRHGPKATVLTGAGMSTESGLPDFRSQHGLWRDRPENLATLQALHAQPCDFYFFINGGLPGYGKQNPTPGIWRWRS